MILKLSDLQRSLDISLATTHGPNRIYLIVGQYCAKASEYATIDPADRQSISRTVRTFPNNSVKTASRLGCSGLP